ncbi:MAG: O-antigen ligase family protein [Rhodoferax sp.]|nr:O-antigen ligase family protein [Rhodoferax sp.]MCF8211823.1 O-antigen ligase family protein [Rhodoferax sp.]
MQVTRYVVFVAMLISIRVIAQHGLQAAFLRVWIPFFLWMPFMFWVNIPGLPDPNFMQTAILPILFVLLRDKLPEMKFGGMEALLLLYVVVRVFADYLGRGYSDAQNYAFYILSSLIGPYLLSRYLIDSRRMDIETARTFVLMFLLLFPVFVYEARFWVSPIFKIFSPLFPNSFSSVSIRWGIARTAGTFEHPILACIMIIAVYRMHRWLSWQGVWDQPQTGWLGVIQRQFKRFPFTFKYQISIILIVMALMTISRGPWIGGFAGATLVLVGNMKNRKQWLYIVLAVFLVGGLAGQAALDAYITPKEGEILSGEAQTMLYRKVMIDQYKGFLMEKFWTGWGLTTVPTIRGMESIDNAFFLMALQHGVFAPAVFVVIFLYAIVTQITFGLKAPPGESPIGFTFSGIYLVCFIAFTTVYMGAQTEPMLFLLLGWGESIKNRKEEPSAGNSATPLASTKLSPFRRVIY